MRLSSLELVSRRSGRSNRTPSCLYSLHGREAASAEVTEYFGWTPDEIEIEGDEGRLVEALLSDRLCVISDGSYKQNLGTAAVQLLPRKGARTALLSSVKPQVCLRIRALTGAN